MPKTKKDAKKAAEATKVKGDTHLLILIDETGSMGGKEEAVVTGVNEFLHRFRKVKGKHRATVAWFDKHPGEPRTRFKVKAKPIKGVKDLDASDYKPRGMTPLNDAILDVVGYADKHAQEDEKVFVVILTDGMENASEASAETVAKLVKKCEKREWGFLYLGANQDAEHAAAQVGLKRKGQAFNFAASKAGVKNAIRTSSNLAASYSSHSNEAYLRGAKLTAEATGSKLPEDEEIEVES